MRNDAKDVGGSHVDVAKRDGAHALTRSRTSLLSGSVCTRKVGSSRWKRFSALEKLMLASLDLGYTQAERP